MKKKLIVSIIALIVATLLGLSADTIKPSIEAAYCKILPEECK